MIRIEITDPDSTDKKALRGIAEYLVSFTEDTPEAESRTIKCIIPEDAMVPGTPVSIPAGTLVPGEWLDTPIPVTPFSPFKDEEVPTAGFKVLSPFNEGVWVDPVQSSETTAVEPPSPPPPVKPKRGEGLDSRGFPWNERIHTRVKTKNKDGSWRYLRDAPPRIVAEVENSFLGIPTPPEVPPPPSKPEVLAPMEFSELMEIIIDATASGKIDRTQIMEVLHKFGFNTIPAVSEHPDKIPVIAGLLKEIIKNAR